MAFELAAYSHSITAHLLSRGMIGAIARGQAEVGPRALGNRSIIGNPTLRGTKERINGLIKSRDAFQPLAPVCLASDFDKYFYYPKARVSLNYMLYAVQCRDAAFQDISAALHVDGTARVQLVLEHNYPFLFGLLTEFKRETGIGVLINTSFNGKGEPLVNDYDGAVEALIRLGLDFLVAGEHLVYAVRD